MTQTQGWRCDRCAIEALGEYPPKGWAFVGVDLFREDGSVEDDCGHLCSRCVQQAFVGVQIQTELTEEVAP